MGRILYIVYLWLFFVPVFLVLTILTAVTVIIGCLLGGEKIFAYYPGMIWSRLTCYLALCPVTVKGREHINRKQSYVFVANHQGAFDIFLIYGFLGVPIKWVMKAHTQGGRAAYLLCSCGAGYRHSRRPCHRHRHCAGKHDPCRMGQGRGQLHHGRDQ